jgi:hypothetical protein
MLWVKVQDHNESGTGIWRNSRKKVLESRYSARRASNRNNHRRFVSVAPTAVFRHVFVSGFHV